MYKKSRLLLIAGLFTSSTLLAQSDNSPYSRYGIGDILNAQNAANRAMGGLSAAYYDYSNLNLLNPAANSKLTSTAFNFGFEINSRTIRSGQSPEKYSNYSPNISYLQLGIPLAQKKGWSMFLGLKPISRISYKVASNERLNFENSTDSVTTVYEGTGGIYAANFGTAIRVFKNFTVGVNAELNFGTRDYSTRRIFVNDTVNYLRSNHQTRTSVNGLVWNGGFQYTIPLNKKTQLQLGAYGRTTTNLKASRENKRETYTPLSTGGTATIDTISFTNDESGQLKLPSNYGVGFIFNRINKYQFGVDYVSTKWSEYSFYNQGDHVQDAWQIKSGFQIFPTPGESYWKNVIYRGGFNFGKDYIKVNDQDLNIWGISAGLSLPMRKSPYSNQFSVIQTTFEYGKRGNNQNLVRENYFQFTLGLSLNDIWFIKRKYD